MDPDLSNPFHEDSPIGLDAWSDDRYENEQVSQLLCIGLYLAGELDPDQPEDEVELGESRRLGVPIIREAGTTARSRPLPRLTALSLNRVGASQDTLKVLWRNMTGWRSARSAMSFLYLNLQSPLPKVRAMAAAVLTGVRESQDKVVASTLDELQDARGLASEFTAMARAHGSASRSIGPDDSATAPGNSSEAVDEYTIPDTSPDESTESISLAIHGTFARLTASAKKWHLPGAKIPTRILKDCTPSLYQRDDYFRWTGGYSDADRITAADDLLRWCRVHGVDELDTVFAHSHGGSITLEAISRGLKVKLLVLLHTPVLPRCDAEWLDIGTRVNRIVEFRTALDWVVNLERLLNHARNSMPPVLAPITRNLSSSVLGKANTSHTRYVKYKVWDKEQIAKEIKFERSLA